MAKKTKAVEDTTINKDKNKITYLAIESILSLGILERLSLKKNVIDNPVINTFSSSVIYKLYYTNIFLQDLLDNFNKENINLDKQTLYTKVPVFFEFYLTTFEYVISTKEDAKVNINVDEIKNILTEISKLNNYIIKAVTYKKGNIRYINLMMSIIVANIQKYSEDIKNFIKTFNISITPPEISEIAQNFTLINSTFLSAVKIDSEILYPITKKDFFSLIRIFPISINEILLDERFKEGDITDYSKLTQYFLGLNLFDEVEKSKLNANLNEKDDFSDIIQFLIDKIMKFKKKENVTEQFFYILDRYNKILEQFFMQSEIYFTKEEIIFIYEQVISRITDDFFDKHILNTIQLKDFLK